MKMIQVDADVHKMIKEQALALGLTMRDYMRVLATKQNLKEK